VDPCVVALPKKIGSCSAGKTSLASVALVPPTTFPLARTLPRGLLPRINSLRKVNAWWRADVSLQQMREHQEVNLQRLA